MKILITGGSGFIGSHLCERLLNDGNDVLCVDNYFTGTKSNISYVQFMCSPQLIVTVPDAGEVPEVETVFTTTPLEQTCTQPPLFLVPNPVDEVLTHPA